MNLLELIKGTPTPTRPGALIELQNPSLRITLAGAIEISRLGLTPQPLIVGHTPSRLDKTVGCELKHQYLK